MPALLLVAHGSRVPEAADAANALTALVAERWDGPVAVGFLELTSPSALDVADSLADDGASAVVVQPLLLLPGNHARFDVQSIADHLAGRGLEVTVGKPIGSDVGALDVAVANVRALGEVDALLVIASGTASDQALRALDTGTALVAQGAGIEHAAAAPTSLDGAAPAAAYRQLREAGHERIAILPWMLFPGRLEQAAVDAIHAAAAETGGEVLVADRFGARPQIADALVSKARRATKLPPNLRA